MQFYVDKERVALAKSLPPKELWAFSVGDTK